MNPRPQSFLRFAPDDHDKIQEQTFIKTNLELSLSDMDSKDLEELDELQVVYSAVTNDIAFGDYVVFINIYKPVTIKHVKSLLHLLDLLLGELLRHIGHAVLL